MRMTKWCAAMAVAALTAVSVQAADAPAKLKVLLITGDDVSPAHNWQETSQTLKQVLDSTGVFEVRISEDPMILDSEAALKPYDVILFAMYNAKLPTISDQAKENLLNYVKSGKGFAVSHLASASFKEWDEFGNLCGRKWVMGTSGHGPRSVFKSNVMGKEHPITQGIDDFETDDELYAKLQGDSEIEVLVQADSDWSKKTEPLVFVKNYGQGRVYHNAYGHDGKALLNPPVAKLWARGVEWAATGKVDKTK